MDRAADDLLLDEALAVVNDARSGAPANFIAALGQILGLTALALIGASALAGGGLLEDFLLNLGVELIGAWVTVVVIDGLWRRLEVGAYSGLDEMSAELSQRRGSAMTDAERKAWTAFIEEYRSLGGQKSVFARAWSAQRSRRKMRELEAHGNRTLRQFRHAAEETPSPR